MKNAAANDKLKKMVKDQQEAEKKKVRLSLQAPGPPGRAPRSLDGGVGSDPALGVGGAPGGQQVTPPHSPLSHLPL